MGEVALAHQLLHHLRTDAVVHGLQIGQGFAVCQQQQRAFAQAQGANTWREFTAGFFGSVEQHGGMGCEGYGVHCSTVR